jgi:hypothetical protein
MLQNDNTGYIIGILWAIQFLFTLHLVKTEWAKKLLITTMWCVVAIFLLPQLINFSMQGILLESGIFTVQVVLILCAKKYDFRFLALAFFVHGCWDLAHLLNQQFIEKPLLFSQVCVPYDWAVAVYIVWRKWT